jgi:hypothetical protein
MQQRKKTMYELKNTYTLNNTQKHLFSFFILHLDWIARSNRRLWQLTRKYLKKKTGLSKITDKDRETKTDLDLQVIYSLS